MLVGWDSINMYQFERTKKKREEIKEVKWEEVKGTKAQSRIPTSDFKLERFVP